MRQIKGATRQFMRDRGIPRLLEILEGSVLEPLFSPGTVLVPVPRSAPLLEPKARWPGREIAEELVEAGLAAEVYEALVRAEPVAKSAWAGRGERPTAMRHFETIRIESAIASPRRVLLVDDVVTMGNTILGAASRLAVQYPDTEILAFALLRTLGLQPEIERVLDPVFGVIELRGNKAWREP